MYSECPTFVYESYVRDLSGMGESWLCAPGTGVDGVWTQFPLNKTSRFPPKKKNAYAFFYPKKGKERKRMADLIKMAETYYTISNRGDPIKYIYK